MDSTTYRLGSDVGGTFTDFVLLDRATGRYELDKVLTTPADPSEGVDTGIGQLSERFPGLLERTDNVIHGTTLVINAVIERKGAPTAVITTQGFRDILEMRREIRYDMYDLAAEYPTPLVDRNLRRELNERTTSLGEIIVPVAAEDAASLLDELVGLGIESVAVCFLHSYASAANEGVVQAVASERHPTLHVSLSSDVLPERKEFERTCATVLNAYVKPLVGRYLERLEDRLRQRGLTHGLSLMLSGGGITSPAVAKQFPVRLIESGPVGGAVASLHLGSQAGLTEIIAFDMGGTTAKACLVRDGRMQITKELEVDRVHRFKKGSGTPTAVPSVDLIEVGAGGGSIARVGRTGILEVGPESSGADPGPIAYARGGTAPTVTDADLVLGYLDAGYFLGGKMQLDVAAAERGIKEQIGDVLGLSMLEAASGIHEVVNENMASAIRMYVAERGGDLSKSTMVAFGGAGPVHAHRLARSLGLPRILVPRAASVFSALGFLVAPVSFESSRTHPIRLDDLDPSSLEATYAELEAEAAGVIATAAPGAGIVFTRSAEMSYVGQSHNIRVDLPKGMPADRSSLGRCFEEEYRKLYGMAYDDLSVQIITLIATATADQEPPSVSLPFLPPGGSLESAVKAQRQAWDPDEGAFVTHTVYSMDALGGEMVIEGPAIVEETGTTLVLGRGASAEVDQRGWLSITV